MTVSQLFIPWSSHLTLVILQLKYLYHALYYYMEICMCFPLPSLECKLLESGDYALLIYDLCPTLKYLTHI